MKNKDAEGQETLEGNQTQSSSSDSTSKVDIPKSYYVGQGYIEDPDRIDALISFKFRPAVFFSNFIFDYEELHVQQFDGGEIFYAAKKKISKKLFDDIINPKDGQPPSGTMTFILGYIRNYLPIINEHIQRQKYLDGHILARTISLWDINGVIVANPKENKDGKITWPVAISGFPPSIRSEEVDAVFIRDMIDAMTDYYHYDLDDCIRKVITSLENCFSYYKLSPTPENLWNRITGLIGVKRTKFRRTVNEYVKEKNYPFEENI